jgi:hypothetical protein
MFRPPVYAPFQESGFTPSRQSQLVQTFFPIVCVLGRVGNTWHIREEGVMNKRDIRSTKLAYAGLVTQNTRSLGRSENVAVAGGPINVTILMPPNVHPENIEVAYKYGGEDDIYDRSRIVEIPRKAAVANAA